MGHRFAILMTHVDAHSLRAPTPVNDAARLLMSSHYSIYTKQELAVSQLEVALQFYMQGTEYPSVITLAGAAEELLGKIAEEGGKQPSLKQSLQKLQARFKAIWETEASESAFAQLRNRAKNELKHWHKGEPICLDFEHEAAALISRALDNFRLCVGSTHPKHHAFTSKKIANWRAKQRTIAQSKSYSRDE